MKALVLLTAITCTAQPWSIFSSFFGGYWTRYPFLRSACWEARKAYSSIINDPHMSRGERENALNNWADQYGLTDSYNRYKNATTTATEERHKAILKILEDLPKFFKDLEMIQTAQNYTYEQERKAVQELHSTLDARDRQVVDFLLHVYTTRPRYNKRSEKDFHDDFSRDVRNPAVNAQIFAVL